MTGALGLNDPLVNTPYLRKPETSIDLMTKRQFCRPLQHPFVKADSHFVPPRHVADDFCYPDKKATVLDNLEPASGVWIVEGHEGRSFYSEY